MKAAFHDDQAFPSSQREMVAVSPCIELGFGERPFTR